MMVELPNVNYDTFLAGGISTDISFEEHFLEKYGSMKCFAFDGTISTLPKQHDGITFVRKNIGDTNTDNITNLHDIIESSERVFVKMDIEGGEIAWIHSLSEEHLNKMEQIVIEFHFPFSEKENAVFIKLNETHILVHFHGNNCCGVRTHENVVIPNVFECTYVHKRHFTDALELNTDSIPGCLDMRNVYNNAEISINHPPFVNGK